MEQKEPKVVEMAVHVVRPKRGPYIVLADFALLWFPFRIKGMRLVQDPNGDYKVWFPSREIRMNREGLREVGKIVLEAYEEAIGEFA